jgi:hypothetical protein
MFLFDELLCDDLTVDKLIAAEDHKKFKSCRGKKETAKYGCNTEDGFYDLHDKSGSTEEAEFAVKEIEFHISCAMGLICEVPAGTLQSVLENYGFVHRSELELSSSFHASYESLRKKIGRTTDKKKRGALITQLCQLYIDHGRVPRPTFRYIDEYYMMKGLIRL